MRNKTSLKRSLGEKIIFLKKSIPNYTYQDIAKTIGCSKSTVGYHLNDSFKEKIKNKLCRKSFKKLHKFCYEKGLPKTGQKFNEERLLRKSFRSYVYGRNRKRKYKQGKMELKHDTKIFNLLNKLWPGIKKEKDVFQAACQWTGKLLTYENGKPIMTPYTRCKLTNQVIDVKSGTCHADHIDGDRTNNSVENFSAVTNWSNQMKAESKNYSEMAQKFIIILQNVRKYDKEVDQLIKEKLEKGEKNE